MILLLYLSSTVGKPGHAIQHSQTSVLHSLPQTQQIICFRAGSVSRNNFNQYNSKMGNKDGWNGDFPGDPVAKTPSSQCRGPRFSPTIIVVMVSKDR